MDDGLASTISLTSSTETFALTQHIRNLIRQTIQEPYSWQEMASTEFQLTVLHNLTETLHANPSPALFYSLLFNRIFFQLEAVQEVASATLFTARADACELLCINLTKTIGYSDPAQTFQLVRILTLAYNPFAGCSPDMFTSGSGSTFQELEGLRDEGRKSAANALEMAVLSEARNFVALPVIQKVVDAIYYGHVTYLPAAHYSLIKDDYKVRGAELCDSRDRPLLDQMLLRVPAVRSFLDNAYLVVILVLFFAVQHSENTRWLMAPEWLFNVAMLGFCLCVWLLQNRHTLKPLGNSDEAAQFVNGMYFSDVWNALDVFYIALYWSYLVLRLYGLATHQPHMSATAFDILSISPTVLLPRLVGGIMTNNLALLALQAMLSDFLGFCILACFSSSGFFFTFYYLADQGQSATHIVWLMCRIFLGNSFLGFEEAKSYHVFWGPVLMAIFALYCNMLLVTVLISILSNTFARIQQNAIQLYLFERTVHTLERIKADALLEYLPPANLLGLLLVGPAKLVLNERYVHKLHVFLVRLTSFHVLLPIALYRRWKSSHAKKGSIYLDEQPESPRKTKSMFSIPQRLLDAGTRTTFLAQQVFDKEVYPARVKEAAGFGGSTPTIGQVSLAKSPPTQDNAVDFDCRLKRIEESLLKLAPPRPLGLGRACFLSETSDAVGTVAVMSGKRFLSQKVCLWSFADPVGPKVHHILRQSHSIQLGRVSSDGVKPETLWRYVDGYQYWQLALAFQDALLGSYATTKPLLVSPIAKMSQGIHRRTASNSYRVAMPGPPPPDPAMNRGKPSRASHFNRSVARATPNLPPWRNLSRRRTRQLLALLLLLVLFLLYRQSSLDLFGDKNAAGHQDVPTVDRNILTKLRKLESYIGYQNAGNDDADPEEDPEEEAYLNFQHQDLKMAPPRVHDIPEPLKIPKPMANTEPTRNWPLEDAASLDAQLCPQSPSGCKFLFPVFLGEQETKAQIHLHQLGMLAAALDRVLVLPNVVRSRMGSCFANPFSYYYDGDSLNKLGIPAISQSQLVDWSRLRDPAPTAQLVNMANVKDDYPGGAIEVDSTSDSTILPFKPDRKFCLQPPRSWLNFTTFSPLAIFPPENWHKQEETRFSFGESVFNTLASEEVVLRSYRSPTGSKKPKKVDSPDVLVVNYELRYPILSPEVLDSLAPESDKFKSIQPFAHFDYASAWMTLSSNLASSLQPFVAIHWRQETLPTANILPCTLKLLDVLRDLSARYPELQKVYLATDYPIEDLEAGREGTVAHSGTFARLLTEDHHRAMRVLLAAFKKNEVGSLQLTTYEREQLAGNVALPDDAEEGLHVNLGELDSGLLGIVDKTVAMAAQMFVVGEPGICAKESSFTRQIIEEREKRLAEQTEANGGEIVLDKDLIWDPVVRWSLEELSGEGEAEAGAEAEAEAGTE